MAFLQVLAFLLIVFLDRSHLLREYFFLCSYVFDVLFSFLSCLCFDIILLGCQDLTLCSEFLLISGKAIQFRLLQCNLLLQTSHLIRKSISLYLKSTLLSPCNKDPNHKTYDKAYNSDNNFHNYDCLLDSII